jgi:cytochrome c oxidase assembly factor CtaG
MRALFKVAALLLISSSGAFAHPGEAHITPSHWATAWSWEPGIVIPLAITVALYAIGVQRIYGRNRRIPAISRWRVIAFAAGWSSLVIALVSPLHKMGGVLFSAHMTQHEVLMVIAAPLLAMGKPLIAFLFALPLRWRERLGSWTSERHFKCAWLWITAPVVVWALHGLTLWVWHLPALYEATLDHEVIHAAQHICFLATALLFWWTLIDGRHGRLAYGAALIYVFTTALHSSVLGALITFTQQLWYPIYSGRTAAWGLDAIADQQLGGLIMWIPSGVTFLVVGLALLAAWLGESERRLRYSRLAELGSAGGHDGD